MKNVDLFLAVIAITLLILLLVSGVIIAFFISGRQRIQQQILLAETKLAFERELRTVETEVTENMMTQFAQELHDNIGQLLTALHIQIENQKLDHPQLAETFKPAEIYVGEINQQLRLLSRTLNNDYIGNTGLFGAIQLEVTRLNALKRFQVQYNPPTGITNLEKNQELMAFRIFQEIVQNALRHSGAKLLTITVDNADQGFTLTVHDDGKGFELDQLLKSGRASGLRNIQKRAALAGMDLNINSSPNQGALFILKKVSKLA